MIQFKKLGKGNIECALNLDSIYTTNELKKFDNRWKEFLLSDGANSYIFKRIGNVIVYPHKSWIPLKKSDKTSLLMLFGNPASHSVRSDIYFAYEGNGKEHRFWKVFRELGYININPNPKTLKDNFFNLKYDSPFRLGFEVIYTFPSAASKPKWSGVAGLEKLFGKKAMKSMMKAEKTRITSLIRQFLENGGAVIALQKDAYNSVAKDSYSVNRAVKFQLKSVFDNSIRVYGIPPTRWLYTTKMKNLLRAIKEEILTSEKAKCPHTSESEVT